MITGYPSSVTAGTQQSLKVTAIDPYGNVTPGYTGTVGLTSSDPQATLRTSYTFTATDAGIHTFLPILKTAGTQWISVKDASNGFSATVSSIKVNPAAVAKLAVAGFPTVELAGIAHTFTVTATDAYGNVITGYTGTVGFTSSDPLAALPASYTFTTADAGTHTFSATLMTVGTQKLKATDAATTSITGTESGIQVEAAAPAAQAQAATTSTGATDEATAFEIGTTDFSPDLDQDLEPRSSKRQVM